MRGFFVKILQKINNFDFGFVINRFHKLEAYDQKIPVRESDIDKDWKPDGKIVKPGISADEKRFPTPSQLKEYAKAPEEISEELLKAGYVRVQDIIIRSQDHCFNDYIVCGHAAQLLYDAIKGMRNKSLDTVLQGAKLGSGRKINMKDISNVPLNRIDTFCASFLTVAELKQFAEDISDPHPLQRDIAYSVLAADHNIDGRGATISRKYQSSPQRKKRYREQQITKTVHCCVFHQNGKIRVSGCNQMADILFFSNVGWHYAANRLCIASQMKPSIQNVDWEVIMKKHAESWFFDCIGLMMFRLYKRVSVGVTPWFVVRRAMVPYRYQDWMDYQKTHRYVLCFICILCVTFKRDYD